MSKTLVDVISRVLAAIIAALLLLKFGLAAAEKYVDATRTHTAGDQR